MDKYEYRVKTEQMLDHLEKKEYQQAMEVADGIDWRRVKNASMLNTVSEIYEYNGEFKKGRDILFLAFDRAPGSRKIVYRLGTLALKIKDIREATDCYEEFVKLAPKDPNQYILKYKILRTQGASLTDQITALEEFKKAEYIEKWAYELAKLYDEAGMTAECLEECDDLILWFSEGKYVYLAMELKMKYKPLTPLQQEKYDSRPGAVKKKTEPEKQPESTLEEVDDENEYNEGTEETAGEPLTERVDESEVQEIPPQEVPMQETVVQEEPAEETIVQEEIPQEEIVEEVPEEVVEENPVYTETEPDTAEHGSAIKQVVTGATLEEALAQGMAVANGITIEEEAMKEREDEKGPIMDCSSLQTALRKSGIPVSNVRRQTIEMWQYWQVKDITGMIGAFENMFVESEASPKEKAGNGVLDLETMFDGVILGSMVNYILEESNLEQCTKILDIMNLVVEKNDNSIFVDMIAKWKDNFEGKKMMIEMGEE